MNRRNLTKSLFVAPLLPIVEKSTIDWKEKDFQKIHNLNRTGWYIHECADEHVDNPDKPSKIISSNPTLTSSVDTYLTEYVGFDELMKNLESLEGDKRLFVCGKILLYRNSGKYYYGLSTIHYHSSKLSVSYTLVKKEWEPFK